jgi:hypothetical protein
MSREPSHGAKNLNFHARERKEGTIDHRALDFLFCDSGGQI